MACGIIQYFHVDFKVKLANISVIRGIITLGRAVIDGDQADEYVTRFRILYSLDGIGFVPYSDQMVSDKV